MTERKHEFDLTADEADYLRWLAKDDDVPAALLQVQQNPNTCRLIVNLSSIEAESLREHLTTKLAVAGFDEDYSPNGQGRMLERLIDKFYRKG